MSKANANYQRECDRVNREIRRTAPKRPRFSKALVLDTIDTFVRSRRYAATEAGSAGQKENALQLYAGANVLDALHATVSPKKFHCSKVCLRAELDARIAGIHASGPAVSAFRGWAQCEGKDDAYCARYGALRAYTDLIEALEL